MARAPEEPSVEQVDIVSGFRWDFVSRVDRRLARLLPAKRRKLRLAAPLVTFTFDDVPDSAATTGAAVLEHHDVHGTFYVAGGLAGKRYETWTFACPVAVRDLARARHEIGCHTYSHPDVQRLSWAEIQTDLERNAQFFAAHGLPARPRNFAYPYGSLGVVQKLRMAQKFGTCRGVHEDVNSDWIDLGQLNAVRLMDGVIDTDGIERWLDAAAARQGWLIFYTHDVETQPSEYGASVRLIEEALRRSLARGYPVVSVAEALELAGIESAPPPAHGL